ncbi:hypothetical protein [Deinococcus sonorensis]|uniref:Uncharacterized protein n=2 Tax=Deinococcus sonorensis TaxID=309891 RepID=A0AAU7UBU8_9DEIO
MLETTPEEFIQRHVAHAARGLVYPQPEGSPLMEFAAGGRVLYLFDRTGPFSQRPGEASVIVHGILNRWAPAEVQAEQLSVVGVSALEGVGRVLERPRPHTAVVQARLPLVLSSFGPLPVQVGDWISFGTEAPLHGFLVSPADHPTLYPGK